MSYIQKQYRFYWKLLLTIVLVTVSSFSLSNSQRIIEYEYDGAGNIVGIRASSNLGPPDVHVLEPAYVNQGSYSDIRATGVNLYQAEVSVTAPGLFLSNVSTTETEITFTLSASMSSTVGPADITFTTRLGSDVEAIAVAERTPVIATDPNPIVLFPDNQTVSVRLIFDQPYTTDQIYDVLITDTLIADVSQQNVTLPAGTTEVSVDVTGLAVGFTTLQINQLSNFLALGIPVIVNDAQLPAGPQIAYSEPLGVSLSTEPPPFTGTGIFTTAKPLGVSLSLEPPPFTGTGMFTTGKPLGTAYGTIISQVSPSSVQRGTSATLILDGYELDVVTAVTFATGTGITKTAPFTVNAEGTQMSIPISVATSATAGLQIIHLTTPSGVLVFSDGVFRITN